MDLSALTAGQTLCERDIAMTPDLVAAYVEAVRADVQLYRELGFAPPMAAAALAMAAAMEAVELPAGAVHTGQELTFAAPAPVGARLRCVATVAANSVRRGARFLSIDLQVSDADGMRVVEGRTSLAVSGEASE